MSYNMYHYKLPFWQEQNEINYELETKLNNKIIQSQFCLLHILQISNFSISLNIIRDKSPIIRCVIGWSLSLVTPFFSCFLYLLYSLILSPQLKFSSAQHSPYLEM